MNKWKGAASKFLYSIVGVPFVLSQWTPFNTKIDGSPEVSVNGKMLTISTKNEAGGFVYFLDKPLPLQKSINLNWRWKVATFPNAPMSGLPKRTRDEDYAIRVGLLLSDGSTRIPLPGKFRKKLDERGHKLSYVLFYCAVPKKVSGKDCGPSPVHGNIVNCLRPAGDMSQSITVMPLNDLRRGLASNKNDLKVIGFWLFADSDGSSSQSMAYISDLTFTKDDE